MCIFWIHMAQIENFFLFLQLYFTNKEIALDLNKHYTYG